MFVDWSGFVGASTRDAMLAKTIASRAGTAASKCWKDSLGV
jgi:hypothetical protein